VRQWLLDHCRCTRHVPRSGEKYGRWRTSDSICTRDLLTLLKQDMRVSLPVCKRAVRFRVAARDNRQRQFHVGCIAADA
jgi:hypothetical protein